MESLSDRIKKFTSASSGFYSGWGAGSSSGVGMDMGGGSGNGSGNSSGCGLGNGSGSGSGGGLDCGSSNGLGWGAGWGEDSGDGSGSGDGSDGIKTYKKQTVHYIDSLPTVIRSAFGNVARGYVIDSDLTTRDCVVVKSGNLFAHGNTFEEAEAALQEKIFDEMDPAEKIEMFREKFKDGVKYPAREFWDWHHKLTGSCEFGRNAFVRDHGIDLDAGMYTVREFIDITKDAYGGEIIGRLEEYYG